MSQSNPTAKTRTQEALDSLDTTRQAIIALSSEIQALREELLAAHVENERLCGEIEPLREKNSDLKQEAARLSSQKDALRAELQGKEQHNSRLNKEILELYQDLRASDLPTLVLRIGMSLTEAEAGLFVEADGDDTIAKIGLESLLEPIEKALYDFSRRAAQDGKPFICNDSNALPDGSNLVNLAAIPVAMRDRDGGVILVANKRSGPFSEDDTNILLAIGRHAQLAMENNRLHCALSESYAHTVAVLADAIEAKDAYTRGHCQSVSDVAVRVATKLGMECEQQDEVRYAALLHDVGKIGVPDGILLKPGRLSPEEFSIIQKHAQIGRDLVARVPTLMPISDHILHHHEKWDGSGYPDGLSGEGIPLPARIIGAVDALDAMTTPRPYRDPVSFDEALEEMRRCSGTQFDPKIVDLVSEVVAENQQSL